LIAQRHFLFGILTAVVDAILALLANLLRRLLHTIGLYHAVGSDLITLLGLIKETRGCSCIIEGGNLLRLGNELYLRALLLLLFFFMLLFFDNDVLGLSLGAVFSRDNGN
jgi:hypothetical protein